MKLLNQRCENYEIVSRKSKLHNELSKSSNLVNKAEKYKKKEIPYLLIIENFIIK